MLLIVALWPAASLAEKLVGPNSVAPEFLKVAERRGAEQIKMAPKRPIKPRYCAGIRLRSVACAWTGDRPTDGLRAMLARPAPNSCDLCSQLTLDAFLRA
jgi:hypothetical protein